MLQTDMNRHNLIVDRDWNIMCHIDLEWTAIIPKEFMQLPLWLTNQVVDKVDVDACNILREEFNQSFEREEETNLVPGFLNKNALQLSSIMNASWARGTFWYVLAMQSPTNRSLVHISRQNPATLLSSIS